MLVGFLRSGRKRLVVGRNGDVVCAIASGGTPLTENKPGSRPTIVVIGSANMDLVVKTERIPAPGETVLGGEFFELPGGKGANQAVAAARLGGNVTFVGRLGSDGFGDSLLMQLESNGIDVSHVGRSTDAASGVALIGVDATGQNSIIVAPGANGLLTIGDIEASRDAIVAATVLVAQLEIPEEVVFHAIRIATDAGVCTILNPAPFASGRSLPADVLACVDVLVPNEHEAAAMLGIKPTAEPDFDEMARQLLNLGARSVVITIGKEGAIVADHDGVSHVAAPTVTSVDSTAAGDCFAGGLAVGLSEGQTLLQAVRFASAAASISVTRLGAQPSLPYRSEVRTIS